jgi:hypothetical protein
MVPLCPLPDKPSNYSSNHFRHVLATIMAPALVQACFCTCWIPFVRAMIAIVVMVLLVIVIRYWVLLPG